MAVVHEEERNSEVAAVLAKARTRSRAAVVRRVLLAVGAVGLVALGLYASGMFGGTRATVRYVTAPATVADLTVMVTATGSVQPTNKVEISSELSGTIRRVLVDYNSTVAVGQTLAELDTDKLVASAERSRARLAAARAKVSEAEATVAERQSDYDRKRELYQRKVISVHDFEAAAAAVRRAAAGLETARAEVGSAEADVRLDETNLAKAAIKSPINGIVLSRNVDPGQTVASTLQAPVLFAIAEDLSKMEIQVDVDEADIGKVREGQRATFAVDAYPDRIFEAEIRTLRFGSETVQGVVTYKAVLTTDNSDMLLRPGMTATAEIVVEEVRDALSVPNAALRFTPTTDTAKPSGGFLRGLLPGPPRFRQASRPDQGAERAVWALRDGQPVRVPVTIGATDGRRTEVRSGEVAAGQPVIVDQISAAR